MVQAGEKLKQSKKKAKMASATSSSRRDWGKVRHTHSVLFLSLFCTPSAHTALSTWQGMACVGRTRECTIVPANHFGPIPGVPVGTMWRFRVQVSADVTGSRHLSSLCLRCGWGQEMLLSGVQEAACLGGLPGCSMILYPCHSQLFYGSWTQPLGQCVLVRDCHPGVWTGSQFPGDGMGLLAVFTGQ